MPPESVFRNQLSILLNKVSQVPKSLCYPYLLSNLATVVQQRDGLDYAILFHDEDVFSEFSNLENEVVERAGYTYDPIVIQG